MPVIPSNNKKDKKDETVATNLKITDIVKRLDSLEKTCQEQETRIQKQDTELELQKTRMQKQTKELELLCGAVLPLYVPALPPLTEVISF